ncbi:MAG: hypothetical protein GX326_06835 [Clostridiaceae bacterium]|nr:hypothetical protein [Clostridiaceae bacterium]
MKLIFAIVNDEDSTRLISELNKENFRVTRLSSTGGFLRSGNTTLLIGVEVSELEFVLEIIRKNSSSRKVSIQTNTAMSEMGTTFMPFPVEVNVGGATVFVVDVEHFERM